MCSTLLATTIAGALPFVQSFLSSKMHEALSDTSVWYRYVESLGGPQVGFASTNRSSILNTKSKFACVAILAFRQHGLGNIPNAQAFNPTYCHESI